MFDAGKNAILAGGSGTELHKRVAQAAKVFEEYGDEIRAVICFNVQNETKADDIFQEFFISLVHNPVPPGLKDIRSYLYRAVTNDVIDSSRQVKNHQDSVEKYAEMRMYSVSQEDPHNMAINTEETEKMFQLIESHLSQRESEVVVQRFGLGLTIADTAEKIRVDRRSVSRYLSMAMKKMRKFVPESGD
ncbi:MAG: RNA polymerase sigma factor [Planctomycetota bacterium]